MSTLSPQEVTAGISRKALDSIKATGKNGDAPHPVASNKIDNNPPIISGFRETSVIDTPMRKLSLLENSDGQVTIRDAHFIGIKCDVVMLHLEREQAHTLAGILQNLDEPAEAGPSPKPTRRVRPA